MALAIRIPRKIGGGAAPRPHVGDEGWSNLTQLPEARTGRVSWCGQGSLHTVAPNFATPAGAACFRSQSRERPLWVWKRLSAGRVRGPAAQLRAHPHSPEGMRRAPVSPTPPRRAASDSVPPLHRTSPQRCHVCRMQGFSQFSCCDADGACSAEAGYVVRHLIGVREEAQRVSIARRQGGTGECLACPRQLASPHLRARARASALRHCRWIGVSIRAASRSSCQRPASKAWIRCSRARAVTVPWDPSGYLLPVSGRDGTRHAYSYNLQPLAK